VVVMAAVESKTVTGRRYKATRPRGFASWRPQKATQQLLVSVALVLEEYADYLPLTVRQVFYRLVGHHDYPKTEADYNALCEKLNRARRAGLIPFDAIRDDGGIAVEPPSFGGESHFWGAVRFSAGNFELDRLLDQPRYLELWCEAGGMVPQISAAVEDYGVPVYSSSGFDSLTVRHAAARRIAEREPQPTLILHVGDYDPSGCAIIDSLAGDVSAFVAEMGAPGLVSFKRLAVTPEQIRQYDLPTAPPKKTDKRGGNWVETVQAEALSPVELRDIVIEAVRSETNVGIWRRVVDQEAEIRARLVRTLDEMG
jgi:hypothetical protein